MDGLKSDFPEQLPDLSLWEGLQDALRLSPKSRRKKKRENPSQESQESADAKNTESTPSGSGTIKLGSRGEHPDASSKFRCESCGKSWNRYGFFIRHVKRQHDMDEFIAKVQKGAESGAQAKVKCNFCRGQVAKADYLDHFWRRHVDHTQPNGAKPCLFCKRTLDGVEKLECHLRVFHFTELHVEPTQFGINVNKALL
ncbi:uncharacterized protein LOC132201212 [Neocloeon triangulifer]|uniref:uncharacterized protein LOC132201212 n=1 Tax=Neocloeon triangulifer TaxID=2078957 RepID=UPI00286EFD2B|nr:uncharacterized protein LOC132201212 [Neocloeon triangulifer]